jgi:hypothetical protein
MTRSEAKNSGTNYELKMSGQVGVQQKSPNGEEPRPNEERHESAKVPLTVIAKEARLKQSLTTNAFLGRDCFAALAMTALFGHFCVFSHNL